MTRQWSAQRFDPDDGETLFSEGCGHASHHGAPKAQNDVDETQTTKTGKCNRAPHRTLQKRPQGWPSQLAARRDRRSNQRHLHVDAKALHGKPFDGHTLKGVLEQLQRLTGVNPGEVYVYQGYKGYKLKDVDTQVTMARQKRKMTPTQTTKTEQCNRTPHQTLQNDRKVGPRNWTPRKTTILADKPIVTI